jgi:hypothetical protein
MWSVQLTLQPLKNLGAPNKVWIARICDNNYFPSLVHQNRFPMTYSFHMARPKQPRIFPRQGLEQPKPSLHVASTALPPLC